MLRTHFTFLILSFMLIVLTSFNINVAAQLSVPGKPGDCPPPTALGICSMTCNRDQQCPGESKCCPTMCGGTSCIMPVTMRQSTSTKKVKPGTCPVKPSGPWVCTSTCEYDTDCRGRLKCCRNRCGAMACIKAEA